MKQDFETAKLYYGFPVIVLGYKDETLGYNITTSSSSYTLGDMMVIGLYTPNNTTAQIKIFKEFTVHVPHIEVMAEVEQAGFVSHRDKLNMTELPYQISPRIDAPILENCPLVMECMVDSISEFDNYTNFTARIVGRQIDEQLLDEKGYLKHEALNPLLYMGDGKARVYRYLDNQTTPLGQFMKDKKRRSRKI